MLEYIGKLFIMSFLVINLYSQEKKMNLDSVTVTAQKQEEFSQDIPMSINVLNEYQIEDQNIKNIYDIADTVPNFAVLSNGMNSVNTPSTRGVFAHIETGLLGTGLYVDGVPTLNATTFESDFINIERVEILKGPQSTLYGKNSTMGVVNIITKEAKEDSINLNLDAGNDEYRSISVNLKKLLFDDKLIFNLITKKERKDGYIKNTYKNIDENNRSKLYTKVDVKYNINDRNSIKVDYTRTKFDDGGYDMTLFGKKDVQSGIDTFNKTKNEFMYFKYIHDFNENFSITSLTSKYNNKIKEQTDYDFSPLSFTDYYNKSKTKEITQEFKVNYKNDKLKLVSGLYLSRMEDRTLTDTDLSAYFGKKVVDNKNRLEDSKSYAIFSQLEYELFEDLNLILGARYEIYKKEFEDKNSKLNLDNKWSNISPKIALQYFINDDSNIYGSISKGYKSGGYNKFMKNSSPSKYYKFDDETLISYEIGTKNTFLDKSLILNTAVYYMKINDMQVQQAVDSSSSYISNAAEASGKGFELDLNYRIIDGLFTNFGFGYSDITFDDFKEDLFDKKGTKIGEVNYKGNKNYYAPKYNYNLGISYRASNGFYTNTSLIAYGKTYLDKRNKYSRKPYKIVNAKLGYETESFDVYLYGKNIFDKSYDSEGYFSGYYTLISTPRQIGLQVKYRF